MSQQFRLYNNEISRSKQGRATNSHFKRTVSCMLTIINVFSVTVGVLLMILFCHASYLKDYRAI